MSTETGTATSFLRLTDTSILPLSSVTFISLSPSNPTVTVSGEKKKRLSNVLFIQRKTATRYEQVLVVLQNLLSLSVMVKFERWEPSST